MNYDKTIRILDPFGGWGNHTEFYRLKDRKFNPRDITMNNDDTGLCNRLFHWEVFYDLYQNALDIDVNLAVQEWIWPELDLLYLPNTLTVGYSNIGTDWYAEIPHADLYFKSIFDDKTKTIRLSEELTHEKIISMYENHNFDFNQTNHWYTTDGYITLETIYEAIGDPDVEKTMHNRPISQISILDKYIEERIRNNCSDKIGIHIRRGNGVVIKDSDIKTLPTAVQNDFKDRVKNVFTMQCDAYHFTPDSVYFDLIDSILDKNPNQKFYISHDLPDEYIKQYYDRYGYEIINTKSDDGWYFHDYYHDKLKNSDMLITYANVIDNVVDLFSLINCKSLIKAKSSWSDFAHYHTPKPAFIIHEVRERLQNDKENLIDEILSFEIQEV